MAAKQEQKEEPPMRASLASRTLWVSFANEKAQKRGEELPVVHEPPEWAASNNGRQDGLPANPCHASRRIENAQGTLTRAWIEEGNARAAEEAAKNPQKNVMFGHGSAVPTRVWGKQKMTKYGGVEQEEGTCDLWKEGDFWNRDSNKKIWDAHHVFRNMANGSHDVHRWDQVRTLRLPGSDRNSTSGLLSADTCFLEMWGYPLGLRTRGGQPTPLWRPVNADEQFRTRASYLQRSSSDGKLFGGRTRSMGPSTLVTTGEPKEDKTLHMGVTHASTSCRGWDRANHSTYREAAKLALSVHGHDTLGQKRTTGLGGPSDYPHDKMSLRPSAIYTLNFRKYGEAALRDHVVKRDKMGSTVRRGVSNERFFGETAERLNRSI